MKAQSIERGQASIASLTPSPYNPRRIDKESRKALANSLRRWGVVQEIVVNRRNNHIVGGHQRVDVLREEGHNDVPVCWVDLDDVDEKALNVALNSPLLSGEYDAPALGELLEAIKAPLGDAFFEMRLAELVPDATIKASDPDEAPDPPKSGDVRSVPGELYELGPHRLLCGSSGDPESWVRLLGEHEQLQAVWTDPPYGVAYVGKTKDALTIDNDDMDPAALRQFLMDTLGLCSVHCAPGAAWYVAAPSGDLFGEFGHVLGREGLGIWRHTLVWVKDRFVMGRADYHYRHESIFYGWTKGAHYFIDDRALDSVLDIPRPTRSADHPTMKPVELVRRCLHNSAKKGWIVGEPFGGSGTTLIAADMEGMRARVIELDPGYCDVIRRRWARHAKETGQDPGPGALHG